MIGDKAHETWTITKPAVESAGGLVASHHYLASEVGAEMLRAGGNAVDAAIAAGLAIGVVEPWMSGIGGIGYLLYRPAGEDRVWCVDMNTRAPAGIDPADYPLAEGVGGDPFGWPAVKDARNLEGYGAFCVPTYVDGAATALARFGTRSWAEALAPAIDLAERGMPCDWYATLRICLGAAGLTRFAESARIFLPGGVPPAQDWGGEMSRIVQGNLPKTLRRLSEAGPRDFYEGEIAASMIADVAAGGGRLEAAELAAVRTEVGEAARLDYRGGAVHTAPGLTAGPSLHQALRLLDASLRPGGRPGPDAYAAYADALAETYAWRLEKMGHDGLEAAPTTTTHLSVVDREGNLVALTQTLLSMFGSRVTLPGTGILLNNSMVSFDPRPGRANSIAPGRRPLSNMCPAIVEREDGLGFAVGSSGGRRIMPAVLQYVSFLSDFGLSVDEAIHQPRIDSSGGPTVTVDARLDAATKAHLAEDREILEAVSGVYPSVFSSPNIAAHNPTRRLNSAGAWVYSPVAAVGVE